MKEGRKVRFNLGRPWRRLLNLFHCDRYGSVARKRSLAAEHLVHQQSERIDVAARIDGFSLGLLRAHICRRAHGEPGLGELLTPCLANRSGDPEIAYDRVPRFEDVEGDGR